MAIAVRPHDSNWDGNIPIQPLAVRQAYLQLLVERVRENADLDANQHVVLVGGRGTGKTTLLRQVAIAIEGDEELNAAWYPLVFGEDAYAIASPGEVWREALFYAGERTRERRWQQAYEDLASETDDKRLAARALAQLMDFADERGQKLLLAIEQLDVLLGEQLQAGDDWELRHTLTNEPRVMLLGTANAPFEEIQAVNRAWFELLEVVHLEPLTDKESQALWNAIVRHDISWHQWRPISILTGGNLRLTRESAKFVAGNETASLTAILMKLVEIQSDYFDAQLAGLAVLERKVFVALLELWEVASARDVAQKARVNVNKASALLRRLVERGAVERIETSSRKHYYRVAERLFCIYYRTVRRGEVGIGVRRFVEFVEQFYREPVGAEAAATLDARDFESTCRGRLEALSACSGELRDTIEFFVAAAAVGLAESTLAAISKSEMLQKLQPLILGLRIYLGEEPLMTCEMTPLAEDIAKSILTLKRTVEMSENGRDSDSNAELKSFEKVLIKPAVL
ncbi:MAG: helix-turn-helix domain-containing protein [Cyanobacteria bacterium J06639_1]